MKLRNYQQHAVDAAINHFKQSQDSAVIVMPTGSGKSIVIAELAKVANGRVLILTHVKELVEQNAEKVALLTQEASIYSAGLNQKSTTNKTVVASIQSAIRAPEKFSTPFSLVIIDECHRVSPDSDSQYQSLLKHLYRINPKLKLLGLTATPYRLVLGWIYQYHYHGKVGNLSQGVFKQCIFELPIRPLIKQGFLSQPKLFDGLSAQYEFSKLTPLSTGQYSETELNSIIDSSGRATEQIINQVSTLAKQRKGVIIFAATVRHAEEVLSLLTKKQLSDKSVALITAKTAQDERDELLLAFKKQQIKFLINVAVLTTGFDAPHVDLIVILRPTASVSLFQQMVGRGLRIASDKQECLIIDYAANGYDIYFPEVGEIKPNSKSVPVQVHCPACGFANTFWGLVNQGGEIIEHFGRRCQAFVAANEETKPPNHSDSKTQQQCNFRFRSRCCPDCGQENDITARECIHCNSLLIDPDKRLKEVLQQKHHHLFRCQDMLFEQRQDRLIIRYIDFDGNDFCQHYLFNTPAQKRAFYATFVHQHTKTPGMKQEQYNQIVDVLNNQSHFRKPDLLLLHKTRYRWELIERFFDYQGRFATEKDINN